MQKLGKIEEKLKAMGIVLPECPSPVAAYRPASKAGKMIFVSGNTAFAGSELLYQGKVGEKISVEEAYQSARVSAIRCLSCLKSVADLDKVRIVQVSGYVNGAPCFDRHPEVVNGASKLIEAVFGEKGLHARKAIGSGSLPDNASVEIEMIAYAED